MSPRPKVGTVLTGDGDSAVVVAGPDASVVDALREALAALDGRSFAADNPVLVEEAAKHRVQVWQSTTKAWREAEGQDPDEDWWSPDGDGKRAIHVVWFPEDLRLHDLADAAAAR